MSKMTETIRSLLRVEYRLVVYHDGNPNPTEIYYQSWRKVRRRAKRLDVPYWTIYKRGPFGLGWRAVQDGYRER